MLSTVLEYIDDIREQLSPLVARAEDEDAEAEEDEEEDEDEDDEDEEEEAGDQLDKIRAQCAETPEGEELKHHYLECAERVEKAKGEPGYEDLDYKEDCIEEFFHLQHYLDSCASPRLFSNLK
ncbi:ubiquinol--cytochrome-c reductase subunit 6 KNAG_0L01200 [Huiozyma naganishii CBS 8797]|uniref:Cytochrome b-c1 complex subunit 6, mitochondrial n=1 Tax=Huiozyma naganishii (strain ATCC MYA-139 / BCRC 22969 / CBS 8797 / KCTC 17520 / NBRC 10181 / NCYC 3082 / Yp74L-3) TaxID=1071383 RepID=J7RCY3_HUIN7|nr:hypothetical protein KNAG_0L01200 [Kazachstania naganishii CBS 8797]CCK72740.1 hypothetical protein KNAG_0L01200 [Kazachstania naganishii CBS 8797]